MNDERINEPFTAAKARAHVQVYKDIEKFRHSERVKEGARILLEEIERYAKIGHSSCNPSRKDIDRHKADVANEIVKILSAEPYLFTIRYNPNTYSVSW